MNEFQAILVEVTFFALRFAVPAAIIYTTARIVHHFVQAEGETDESVGHAPQ